MLLKVAYRNLAVRPLRTLGVGAVIAFGAYLAVVGGSLVSSMTGSLRQALTRSLVGDLQAYSGSAKDEFSLFPSQFGGRPKIGNLPDFGALKTALLKDPGVAEVVPQGVAFALVNPGNILDVKLDDLREATKARPRDKAKVADLKAQVRRIVQGTEENYRQVLLPSGVVQAEDRPGYERALKRSLSPAFWQGFDSAPEPALEYLSNNIASLIFDNTQFYFLYIGTQPQTMARAFPNIQVVKGAMIPEGERGFMINDFIYETQVKDLYARRLDQVRDALKEGRRIDKDASLAGLLKSNREQVGELLTQLSPSDAQIVDRELAQALPQGGKDLKERVQALFASDDAAFAAHYELFYRVLAPRIVLYRLKVGSSFPLKAFSESGFANAANVKVWGTFKFRGFESSPLAGNFSLVDLATFRDLYGFETPARKAQTDALAREMEAVAGGLELGREDFESAFREPATMEAKKKRSTTPVEKPKGTVARYDTPQQALEAGPCVNAAIVLKAGVDPDQAKPRIERLLKAEGLDVKLVGWEKASGLLGMLARVFGGILWSLIALVFIVGAFVVQNTMFMAAMERTSEIGTLRAIGAQRAVVLKLVFVEALVLALLGAIAGAGLGTVTVLWLGKVGLPAPDPRAAFLFSGSRLYPVLEPWWALGAMIGTASLALLASVYPAWSAARISPLKAMQKD